jgi:hypothetical protein
MNKTRIDDMLIEMISPKIKEIEEKFSTGKGLNQEDINTLLLKSQYNHINHLDDKLNEVTADISSLKGEFNTKFIQLETKLEQAQVKMQDTIISTMKWYIGGAVVVLILLKALDIFVK